MIRPTSRVRAVFGATLVLAAVVLPADPARAEEEGIGLRGWGPTVGMNLSPDQVTVGLMGDFGTFATPLGLLGFVDMGFGDDRTTLIVAPSAVARIPAGDLGTMYGGISLGIAYASFDVTDEAKDVAERHGFTIDDSSTDFVAAVDFGFLYPLEQGNGLVFDFRVGLVDDHPDFKASLGYGLGLFD